MGGVRVAGIHELHLLDGGPVERVDGDPVDERGIEAACRQLKVQHVLVTRSEAILQPKRLFRLEQIVRGLEGGVEIGSSLIVGGPGLEPGGESAAEDDQTQEHGKQRDRRVPADPTREAECPAFDRVID